MLLTPLAYEKSRNSWRRRLIGGSKYGAKGGGKVWGGGQKGKPKKGLGMGG